MFLIPSNHDIWSVRDHILLSSRGGCSRGVESSSFELSPHKEGTYRIEGRGTLNVKIIWDVTDMVSVIMMMDDNRSSLMLSLSEWGLERIISFIPIDAQG
jgi:hypothetical protein